MNKAAWLILLFLFTTSVAIGQKPVIDTTVEGSWPTFDNGKISRDGKYVAYRVNYIYRYAVKRSAVVCKAVSSDWEIEIEGTMIRSFEFDNNSKKLIIEASGDSLQILYLGRDRLEHLTGVQSFQLSQSHLIYQMGSALHILNLLTDKKILINNIANYVFHKASQNLLVECNSSGKQELLLHQLPTGRQRIIESVPDAKNFTFNVEGDQIAMLGKEGDMVMLCVYDINRRQLKRFSQGDLGNIPSDLYLSGINSFTPNSQYVMVSLRSNKKINSSPNQQILKDSIEVWSYSDIIPADYTFDENPRNEFKTVINLSNGKLQVIETERERIMSISNDFAIISRQLWNGLGDERHWTNFQRPESYIVYFKNGFHKKLMFDASVSPTGKYLWFYKGGDFFAFDTQTGTVRNITASIKTDWTTYYRDSTHGIPSESVDIRHIWLKDDEALILHDQYDLWQVDPSGKRSPICLTNKYGYKHKISFNPHIPTPFGSTTPIFRDGEKLLIPAIDRGTKDNGFFYVTIGKSEDPEKVILDQYHYFIPHGHVHAWGGEYPSKAENANIWLILRMSAKDYPNYYITTDFKEFKPVTNSYPEKNFNWLTSELHAYPDSSGRMIQGVLYKPEDFNPAKRYPVIFYYYEKLSNDLNSFPRPELSDGPMNIPWFVSRGYLVFTPDIHYLIGSACKSALNAVTSAAHYVMKLPYVDSTKMGLQGHSFGAVQTNFIITQTRLFTAACSASGISNFVSYYGRIGGTYGPGNRIWAELGQGRFGSTPWESPQNYIENSPVFFLHKITTPLLMMHGSKDQACTLVQAAEMFNGMRRLGKTCWMILYKNEGHTLGTHEHRLDYTQRLQQFFDYYLKGSPVPEWMIKSGSTSFSLDATGKPPKGGILSKEELQKFESIERRKPITITIP